MVVGVLDDAGIPGMVTGSLASSFYATPRATQDVDVVIAADPDGIDRLVSGLLSLGLYVDRAAAHSAGRNHSQFNAIHPESGWKVDLICRRDRAFSVMEFSRRRPVNLLGVEVAIASLEDLVLSKLEWSRMGDSELQRRDVLHLLEQRGGEIDRAYVDRWARELGLESEWRTVLEAAPFDPQPDP